MVSVRVPSKLRPCSWQPLVPRRSLRTRPASKTIIPDAPPKSSISKHGLCYYWDTNPPTPDQLRRADKFFQAAPPKLLFSATTFRTVATSPIPEVAFLGRSNVGKSSLLNSLMGKNICHTSSKPGRTRSMNFFAVGEEDAQGNEGRLVVLDMPGYGKGSREEWGEEIMKYLVGRRQMKRAFLLVDPLHGLKRSDAEILRLFRENAVPHQIILSKVDRILFPNNKKPSTERIERNSPDLDRICEDLRQQIQPGQGEGPEALGEILTCSGEATLGGRKIGIDSVRWAVLAATGLGDEKSRIVRSGLADADTKINVTQPQGDLL